jgi:hypothetical protein
MNRASSWLALVSAMLVGCASNAGIRARTCVEPAQPAVSSLAALSSGHATRNLILVTIDGVRWQEIFDGVEASRARSAGLASCEIVPANQLVPHLSALARAGVALGGDERAPVVATGPNFVSLPGYREILTGRASRACTHNLCGPIGETTLLDELHREGLPSDQVAMIASWERLERAAALDVGDITVSAGRHHGATRDGVRVSPRASALLDEAARSSAYPGYFDYRPDRYTALLALEYVQAKRPRFLHVALGDTDERAHRGDYAGYLDALRAADRFVGELEAMLATLDGYGEQTTLVITTDHGRSRHFRGHGGDAPESARVWVIAAGGAVQARGFTQTMRPMHLADLAPTMRVLLGMARPTASGGGVPIVELIAAPAGSVFAARAP